MTKIFLHLRCWLLIVVMVILGSTTTLAQPRITDTPLPVVLPTMTAPPTGIAILTPTSTAQATQIPAIVLRAAAAPGDINVRNLPEATGNRLGSLDQTRDYIVTGRFFSWFQFEYDSSPTGLAWVFGDLVEIVGDENAIPIVDPFALPTAIPTEAAAAATSTAFAATPGAAETATAQTRLIAVETSQENSNPGEEFPATFTPPPNLVSRAGENTQQQITPTPPARFANEVVSTIAVQGLPPIVPIALLGIFGLLGLFVALLRG